MAKYVSDAIIQTLGDVTDLQRVLEEYDMSAREILCTIRSRRGRQQIRARRQLAKIHSELVAHRFSPYAVHKLCQLLSEEKPELRLKGALSILALAGFDGKAKTERGKKKGEAAAGEETVRTPEDGEVLLALAEVLKKRRADAKGDSGEK